ncbi:MAG: hypothetical protein WCO93_11600 [bacterium]
MKSLNNSGRIYILLFFVLSVALMTGCANAEPVKECLKGDPYGFWAGLWHGIIAPINFVISLFKDNFTLYAQNNNGGWYAFGFLIGSGGWGFFGGHSASRKWR